MAFNNSSDMKTAPSAQDEMRQTFASFNDVPSIGTTSPQLLARDAAEGKRGAAWRLMLWILQDDPRAMTAVAMTDDDRFIDHLLEFIANGTWSGKPFVTPQPLRTAYARTRLRTLFLPDSGINTTRAERVLLHEVTNQQGTIRAEAMHLLGLMKSHRAVPALISALRDPLPNVHLQAAKALGRIGDPTAVSALLNALPHADEQMGSQISNALAQIGKEAVPVLIERYKNSTAWVRWHCIRALGEICDSRTLPVLVEALRDPDHAVAWMGAKEVRHFGKDSLRPMLHLLMTAETSPWLIETTTYVLRDLEHRDSQLMPYLKPLVQQMHEPAARTITPLAAQKTLAHLEQAGII